MAKRYDHMGFEAEFGRWVRWVDHDALEQQLAEMRGQNSALMASNVKLRDFATTARCSGASGEALQRSAERVLAQVDAMESAALKEAT